MPFSARVACPIAPDSKGGVWLSEGVAIGASPRTRVQASARELRSACGDAHINANPDAKASRWRGVLRAAAEKVL
eukprot:scaffold1496_cov110-Isochrysis_galbana.AAC.18